MDDGLVTFAPVDQRQLHTSRRLVVLLAALVLQVSSAFVGINEAMFDDQPTTVAVLGLPAGLEFQLNQLEDLVRSGTIDYYETRAREVICYWRTLAPSEQVRLTLDLIAAVPGSFTGPPPRVYLHDDPERKSENAPLSVEITRD